MKATLKSPQILAPCICGATAELKVGPDMATSGNEWIAWVRCPKCEFASNGALHSEVGAVRQWNKIIEKLRAKQ